MLIDKVDETKLTPMMKQYLDIKKKYRDIILFYRLGDFYEMFFDDAIIASKELELVLTSRDAGLDEKVPMAGIPHHSSNPYISRLVDKGYKIAIVEQLEDPAQAKGIVKRNVVKIISPGTLVDLEGKDKDNNFLLSTYGSNNSYGISYIDVTTGEFKTTEILNSTDIEKDLLDFIVKANPREIVLEKELPFKRIKDYIDDNNIYISYVDTNKMDSKTTLESISKRLKNFRQSLFKDKLFSIMSISMLLDYIYLFREERLSHIDNIVYIENKSFMKIDASTRENLEIHRNLNDKSKKNTLLSILDKAETPMGSRKINSWLEFPLLDRDDINRRLDIVEVFYMDQDLSNSLESVLSNVYDLERTLSKITYRNANARDLLHLKNSLEYLPQFKSLLENSDSKILNNLIDGFDDLRDLYDLIDKAIVEEPPIQLKEGGLIKEGFSEKLDHIRFDSTRGKELLLEYELSERERTGINKLKVSYNKNVGYYIEVTKANISKVPEDYTRRQTLKNSERYVTSRLNELSDMVLGSQSEIEELEYEIFDQIRTRVSENSTRVKTSSDLIARVDALNSFSKVALENNYTRPIFNKENYISIKDGRHPVVEQTMGKNEFIANDALIGKNNKIIQIITGPNMAGKSTYMRQIALIILMAQVGSFVPAVSCDIALSDAIFTRIGASDNLAKGDSTFMVEMKEMSNIIANANENSFVILDEVGRGTGTNDGYSIAKAIVEYMSQHNKSKTLFATHYHELTDLTSSLNNLENLKVDIKEKNGEIVFLRKIVKGKTNKSYGIEVAKLSGLPEEIIFRANKIFNSLEYSPIEENQQLGFGQADISSSQERLKEEIIIKELKELDINNITPINSLEILDNFINKARDIDND